MTYNAETNRFVPKYVGKVEGVRGNEVRVGGRWRVLGSPWWTNEEEARKACDGRGAVMPAIK
jgi:hypothetical protein